MIKCNVTACGIIVSSAVEKQNKEGGKFLAFTLVVPIVGQLTSNWKAPGRSREQN